MSDTSGDDELARDQGFLHTGERRDKTNPDCLHEVPFIVDGGSNVYMAVLPEILGNREPEEIMVIMVYVGAGSTTADHMVMNQLGLTVRYEVY